MKMSFGPLASVVLGLLVASTACSSDTTPGTGGTAGAGGSGASAGAAGSGGAAGSSDGSASGGASGSVANEAGADSGTGGAGGAADAARDATGAAAAEGGADVAIGDGGAVEITHSSGTWVVYPEPFGSDGGDNPLASSIMGVARAYALAGGKMRVTLSVTGLPPNRPCGSHLHVGVCETNKAGGHYQNNPFPAEGGSANDPTFANDANEVWLDFSTDANGAARSETTVNWVPRMGGANAIMIHDKKTGEGGIAGSKLACTNMPF